MACAAAVPRLVLLVGLPSEDAGVVQRDPSPTRHLFQSTRDPDGRRRPPASHAKWTWPRRRIGESGAGPPGRESQREGSTHRACVGSHQGTRDRSPWRAPGPGTATGPRRGPVPQGHVRTPALRRPTREVAGTPACHSPALRAGLERPQRLWWLWAPAHLGNRFSAVSRCICPRAGTG